MSIENSKEGAKNPGKVGLVTCFLPYLTVKLPPWHYRYVGIEVATFIKENDMCYEEFYKHYVPDFQD